MGEVEIRDNPRWVASGDLYNNIKVKPYGEIKKNL